MAEQLNYKDEATTAMSANADPRLAAAIIQAKALDRLSHAILAAATPHPPHATSGPNK